MQQPFPRFINRLNLGESDDVPWGEYRALCRVASAALNLCNGGIDESRPDGMHLFDADLVKALNDALDELEEVEWGDE